MFLLKIYNEQLCIQNNYAKPENAKPINQTKTKQKQNGPHPKNATCQIEPTKKHVTKLNFNFVTSQTQFSHKRKGGGGLPKVHQCPLKSGTAHRKTTNSNHLVQNQNQMLNQAFDFDFPSTTDVGTEKIIYKQTTFLPIMWFYG
eukprot:TRINITY_DN6886_c0_g1_i4.p3 TRINITY_DN6886_c0_g1~~TRINITY_DN6886_c0_g1_i4.p3  ORF type:complete len:144 (-),score=8.52 TRINITY_DN6886_c0_g1_i4:304-735(-)